MSTYPNTVRDLIEEIKKWYREGFLYDSVWKELARYIKPDLLPTEADINHMKREELTIFIEPDLLPTESETNRMKRAIRHQKQNRGNRISRKCLLKMCIALVLLFALTPGYLAYLASGIITLLV